MSFKKVLPVILAIALFAIACGNDDGDVGISIPGSVIQINPEGLVTGGYDGLDVEQIYAGGFHTCAIVGAARSAYCWGNNEGGQLGDGTRTIRDENGDVADDENKDIPINVKDLTGSGFLTNVNSITAGPDHTCAIVGAARSAYCWGNNEGGQLGDGTEDNKLIPTQVKDPTGSGSLTNVYSITAGSNHSCAIVGIDRFVYCWGRNRDGQLGDGTDENKEIPTQVKDLTGSGFLINVDSIVTGSDHNCVIVGTDRSAYCWGRNLYGQLGDGTEDNKEIPTQVKDLTGRGSLTNVHSITAGFDHTCAVVGANRSAYCWGRNRDGQLGDGTENDKEIPTQVKDSTGSGSLIGVYSIINGSDHTCATVGIDRSAYCWGRNRDGQLGDGSRDNKNLPTQVKEPTGEEFLTNVHSITAGLFHTCVILETDRSAYCWGWDGYGQLGGEN